jgi:hypothetical protein
VKVWDAETGREVLSLKGHRGGVSWVGYSPDGKRLVSGGGDGTPKVWGARAEEVLTLKGAAERVSVAFSPDGKRISGMDRSGKVVTWDATTGQTLPDAGPMPARSRTEVASPDGSLRAFIQNGQVKVVRLPDFVEAQKRQQSQGRAFLERLARPDPAYHRHKADPYEKSGKPGDHFAAAFHLRRLLLIGPKDDAVHQRLAATEARLRAQMKAEPLPEKQPARMPYAR